VTNEGRLVHAEIVIENKGDVMLKSKSAQLRLRQVAPVPDEICGCAQQNIDPVPDGKTEIEWPCIAQRDWNWKEGEFEVEPGESDYLHADFLIPHSISVVELYFFLANPAKSHKGLGWTRTKIHRFDEREDDKTMAKETSLGQQKLNEQQKLQKQQKPQQPQIQQQQKPQQLPQQKPK